MKTVIKIENLSKLYRLGEVGTGTISHDLNRLIAKIRGKEDPFAIVGQTNDRTQTAQKGEHVWALQDINFDVKEGEVLGIIGKNGAGKSTLLKILSRITSPTTGSFKIKGRMASLLEVGTGFHPEMTGRENIFMNGTIMGMRKWEVQKKLDEIVEFAGVAKYLDTPVKRYSSGMTVRLGFAVAAHLEPEILVVDEVLAVGDAEFQKKAIGKMQDVSKNQGRTVLFVSHNMGAVKKLCNKGLLLKYGNLKFEGTQEDVVDYYVNNENSKKRSYYESGNSLGIINVCFNNSNFFAIDEDIEIKFKIVQPDNYKNAVLSFRIVDKSDVCIFSTLTKPREHSNNEVVTLSATIPKRFLMPGTYYLSVALHIPNQLIISKVENAVFFTIEETGSELFQFTQKKIGYVFSNVKWSNVQD